jgi:cyclic pyranopterin phosphate synthase
MKGPLDPFGRSIDYLRISVTDRCNLRCIYCMPPEGVPHISHSEILSYEEIRVVVQAAAQLGIRRIRLTGGEPLVRVDFPELVKMLSRIEGITELSLTTNGTLLKDYAYALKQAGLSRVNVSLDALRADRFQDITRVGELEDVLAGIEAAKEAGLHPIKMNTVVMRGINDDEILDFARMTYTEGWHVRFIELMPFKGVAQPVPSVEVQQHVSSLGSLEPCMSITGNGPAKYYRLAGAEGTIGFISPLTEISFCSRCNRMRLTPDGKLRPCLLGDDEIDLRTPLRNNASMEELRRLILKAVASKPEHHHLKDTNDRPLERKMSQIGG